MGNFGWELRRENNPYNYLIFIGYHHVYSGVTKRGKYGVLSKRKQNWGAYKLAEYMSRKYPEDYIVWRTRCRMEIGGERWI